MSTFVAVSAHGSVVVGLFQCLGGSLPPLCNCKKMPPIRPLRGVLAIVTRTRPPNAARAAHRSARSGPVRARADAREPCTSGGRARTRPRIVPAQGEARLLPAGTGSRTSPAGSCPRGGTSGGREEAPEDRACAGGRPTPTGGHAVEEEPGIPHARVHVRRTRPRIASMRGEVRVSPAPSPPDDGRAARSAGSAVRNAPPTRAKAGRRGPAGGSPEANPLRSFAASPSGGTFPRAEPPSRERGRSPRRRRRVSAASRAPEATPRGATARRQRAGRPARRRRGGATGADRRRATSRVRRG